MTYLKPAWPAPASVHAYTTTRKGWGYPYPLTQDIKSSLQTMLSMPSDPIWINQTHSNIPLEATKAHKDQCADATFTRNQDTVCIVLTADCLPILLCNQQGSEVAAIHAGWRGLAHGIIKKTVQNLTSPSDQLMAWLGPAIGPEKFEVGLDVYTAFTSADTEATQAFTPYSPGKWLANIYRLATLQLTQLGITRIYGGQYCTYTQADLFYSYRRDQGKTGRMASVIWIQK